MLRSTAETAADIREEIVTNRFLSCAGYGAALLAFTLAAAPAAHAQGKWRRRAYSARRQ